MNTLKKKFRQIKKFPDWIFLFPALFLKTLKLLMRTELSDPFDHIHSEAPIVTVTWHNRLLFFPVMFPRWIRKKTIAIVSASRDGQYVTDLIRYFGLKSLRGSSSRRGAPVFREAVKALKQGYHVSFTPDGPRGPKYRMSRGPVRLASMTGSRIIPISVNYSSYWQLKSWDNFQIPKPWAKIILVLGPAVEVPPEIDDKEIEEYRKIVENALMKITLD
jgi:hypothetical protein